MKGLVATGVQQSDSFRSLLETLSSHPEVSLKMQISRQRAGVRAQSDLKVTFIYLTEGGRQRRQNTGVSGRVTVPCVTYAHWQIGLIAHELAHVLIRLRGGTPMARDEEEQLALDVEAMVLAELGVMERVAR
jgi:hypothetical protein